MSQFNSNAVLEAAWLGRVKRAQHLRMIQAAIIIQKFMRMWLEKQRYEKARQDTIKVQSCVRRWMAKRRLKALKTEARSLEHVRQLNKGLENKIISLQQRIEELSKGANKNKKVATDYEKVKVQLDNFKHMEKDFKAALEKIGELEGLNDRLEGELRGKMDAEVDFVTTKVELDSENAKLREQVVELQVKVKHLGDELEESKLKEAENEKLRRELATFGKEREMEQQTYQQLLKKVHDMEQNFVGGGREQHGNVSSRPTPVLRKNLAPASLDSGLPSLDRSPSPTRRALQAQSPNLIQQNVSEPDIGLVLVLQQKLIQSEKERKSLEKLLEDQSATNPDSETRRTQDLIRLQELEMENAKLRDDLNRLRSTEDTNSEISRQFQSL
ncbi:unnamed protein product [Orchesella dallaii]|uniref:Uncharacterized protein n=1 Tax=Orchesella dallaii TaxID=48710 RepID=A0ABP1RI37_9HEXA